MQCHVHNTQAAASCLSCAYSGADTHIWEFWMGSGTAGLEPAAPVGPPPPDHAPSINHAPMQTTPPLKPRP